MHQGKTTLERILVIQTAYPGDVVLATSVIESLRNSCSHASIDVLIRKGNESLFNEHPFINKVIILDKQRAKAGRLYSVIKQVRSERYDLIINLHRFASSGLITALSGATETRGFKKNPFSFCFDVSVRHTVGDGIHEIERNHRLIKDLCGNRPSKPCLYPDKASTEAIAPFKTEDKYICVAPASVWYTKQYPPDKWADFIRRADSQFKVFLIGGPTDYDLCNEIIRESGRGENLCGKLSFLASAALMKDAAMNYVNDSAPLHLASAVDAPITALFCSTVPAFGFGPLSANSRIVECPEKLNCRPCGLHGKKACPEGHFRCARNINTSALLEGLKA